MQLPVKHWLHVQRGAQRVREAGNRQITGTDDDIEVGKHGQRKDLKPARVRTCVGTVAGWEQMAHGRRVPRSHAAQSTVFTLHPGIAPPAGSQHVYCSTPPLPKNSPPHAPRAVGAAAGAQPRALARPRGRLPLAAIGRAPARGRPTCGRVWPKAAVPTATDAGHADQAPIVPPGPERGRRQREGGCPQ